MRKSLKPADLREIQVEEDERRTRRGVAVAGEEVRQRLGAVSHHDDLVADVALLEGPQRQRLVVGVVLYQQDSSACHALPFPSKVK